MTADEETKLWDAVNSNDIGKIEDVFKKYPKVNPNCTDKDELTPLQLACHKGNLELARVLIKHKADVNDTKRKDRYTALMFAAIGGHTELVRLLLENGADSTHENCVNRNASQMAAFVTQYSSVAIITHWIPYKLIQPYTKCRELESEPRLPSQELGRLLHSYVTVPSVHPVKIILFLKENLDLLKYAEKNLYVLENLASKSIQPPKSDESLALKFHYSSFILNYCQKLVAAHIEKSIESKEGNETGRFDEKKCIEVIESLLKRLVFRKDYSDNNPCTVEVNKLIINSIMKFPYTNLGIFKTMTFALTKGADSEAPSALCIISQMLDGPRMFGNIPEACKVCGEKDKNKKCSRCRSVYYCGPGCQKADWYSHKKRCKDPEKTPLLDDVE